MKLQKTREVLALLLIGMLPLHAFLVTVGTKLIAGPNQAPLAELAIWKEALIAIILLVAVTEILLQRKFVAGFFKWDLIDALLIALIILSLVVSFPFADISQYILGFRYDFAAPVVFFILRRVEWSVWFQESVKILLLCVGSMVALFGIAMLFFADPFLQALGYADLHSVYQADGPLAAYQNVGGTAVRRMQSTMSGPNQLGLWLLLPWTLALIQLVSAPRKISNWLLFLLFDVSIFLTFSRSAWMAASVLFIIILFQSFSRKLFTKIIGVAAVLLLVTGLLTAWLAPHIILRAESTKDHFERPLMAIHTMFENPFGLGLGTAGPASNHFSDTCMYFPEGADTTWAEDRPDLCIFAGGGQVQPMEPCNCPVVPENWYLQIGVEMGILGFVLFIFFIVSILRKGSFQNPIILFFLGISIACLFLHAWEDAAVAYTAWVLLSIQKKRF